MTNAAKKQLESPEVLNWLTLKFADWLEVLPDELDPQQPISSYGLDWLCPNSASCPKS